MCDGDSTRHRSLAPIARGAISVLSPPKGNKLLQIAIQRQGQFKSTLLPPALRKLSDTLTYLYHRDNIDGPSLFDSWAMEVWSAV